MIKRVLFLTFVQLVYAVALGAVGALLGDHFRTGALIGALILPTGITVDHLFLRSKND